MSKAKILIEMLRTGPLASCNPNKRLTKAKSIGKGNKYCAVKIGEYLFRIPVKDIRKVFLDGIIVDAPDWLSTYKLKIKGYAEKVIFTFGDGKYDKSSSYLSLYLSKSQEPYLDSLVDVIENSKYEIRRGEARLIWIPTEREGYLVLWHGKQKIRAVFIAKQVDKDKFKLLYEADKREYRSLAPQFSKFNDFIIAV